jgi:hypothetical protein
VKQIPLYKRGEFYASSTFVHFLPKPYLARKRIQDLHRIADLHATATDSQTVHLRSPVIHNNSKRPLLKVSRVNRLEITPQRCGSHAVERSLESTLSIVLSFNPTLGRSVDLSRGLHVNSHNRGLIHPT